MLLHVEKQMTSVFELLSFIWLAFIQAAISSTTLTFFLASPLMHQMNNAHIIECRRHIDEFSNCKKLQSKSAVYKVNKSGPRTEPCGTPVE